MIFGENKQLLSQILTLPTNRFHKVQSLLNLNLILHVCMFVSCVKIDINAAELLKASEQRSSLHSMLQKPIYNFVHDIKPPILFSPIFFTNFSQLEQLKKKTSFLLVRFGPMKSLCSKIRCSLNYLSPSKNLSSYVNAP